MEGGSPLTRGGWSPLTREEGVHLLGEEGIYILGEKETRYEQQLFLLCFRNKERKNSNIPVFGFCLLALMKSILRIAWPSKALQVDLTICT